MEADSLLPREFEFYHLGEVRLAEAPATTPPGDPMDDQIAGCELVGFRVHGDFDGWIVLAFDADLDFATYAEMGNVIASRAATTAGDAMIGPPRKLSPAQALSLSSGGTSRLYHHVHRGTVIPVRAWIKGESDV